MIEQQGVFVYGASPRGSSGTVRSGAPQTSAPSSLATSTDGDSWVQEARCRQEDASLFFGPNRFEPKRERLAREAAAKLVCLGCPALMVCREQALANQEPYGVWGGLGEHDRQQLLARGSVAAAI